MITLETLVARTRKAPRALVTVQPPGYGLSIARAPEVYFEFLLTLPSTRG